MATSFDPGSLQAAPLGAEGVVAFEAGFDSALGLLHTSPGLRLALRETEEGAALAERLLGHRIRAEGDFGRMERELKRPEHARLLERVAPSFARINAAVGDASIRGAARELGFVDEAASGFVAARAAFLNPQGVAVQSVHAQNLKVAAVQYPVQGGRSFEQFLAKVEGYAHQAQAQGAGLIVFPELAVLDRVDAEAALSEARQLEVIARHETPRIFARISQMSRELGLPILGGSFPRETLEGIVNTAILAFPDGRVVFQDKLNLTPDEKAWGWKTGHELNVFDTPWGRTTILICYDSQSPALSAALSESAPEVILVPSMTGAKGFQRVRWAAQSRAVEQHAFVVVTGTVDAPGLAGPAQFSAQAAFLTPQEEGFPGLLHQGPQDQEALVFADLDLAMLRESRRSTGLYAGRDDVERKIPVKVNR